MAQPRETMYTAPISDSLSLRLYSDTRPHNHHTSELQKGLILVHRGTEMVGEGVGFGIPVLRYLKKDYFAGSATLRIHRQRDRTTAIKTFTLDTVLEKKFRNIKPENAIARKFTRQLEELYQAHGNWRWLMLKKSFLENIGLQTSFARGRPAGNVTVTYDIDNSRVHVRADFEVYEKTDLQKVFLLNEQGSRFFRKYRDSAGTVLSDEKIGAWEKVEADWASVSNKDGDVSFRLWRIQDVLLYRGREFLNGSFDWIGLDYELSPGKTCFEYDIEIFGSSNCR